MLARPVVVGTAHLAVDGLQQIRRHCHEKRLAEETKDDSLYSGFGIACNGQLSAIALARIALQLLDDPGREFAAWMHDGVGSADHPIAIQDSELHRRWIVRHLVDKLLAAAGVDANSC